MTQRAEDELPTHQGVAAEVRAEMARQRISGRRAAMQLGWTQPYLSRRLTGEIPFNVAELSELAGLLEVPISAFFPQNRGALLKGVRTAPIRSAGRFCGYCHRAIYRQRDGSWYHEHNASVFCHPGDGSGREAFPAGLYQSVLGLAA